LPKSGGKWDRNVFAEEKPLDFRGVTDRINAKGQKACAPPATDPTRLKGPYDYCTKGLVLPFRHKARKTEKAKGGLVLYSGRGDAKEEGGTECRKIGFADQAQKRVGCVTKEWKRRLTAERKRIRKSPGEARA